MKRRKLKTGTRQYGKPASAVSLAPCPWDMGAETLAAKACGEVGEAVTELREYIRQSRPKPIKIFEEVTNEETGEIIHVGRDETEREMLRRVSTAFLKRGGGQHRTVVENRGDIDPETGKEINPNGVTGVRRISVAENYYRNGHLTKRQYTAAHALLVAWERKDLTPTLYAERVDSSGKPDDRTAILVDHQTAYIRVSRHVPKKYAKFVYHVARDDCKISTLPGYRKGNRFMEYLRTGLDILADNLEKV